MIEPLLDVGLPNDLALPGASSGLAYRAGEATAEKIVLLEQVYVNVGGQEKVREICRKLADEAGVRIIAVEGATGLVPMNPRATAVADLIRGPERCTVSPGVQVFHNRDRPDVEVWGVDDMDAEARSLEAMQRVQAAAPLRDAIFGGLTQLLRAAQKRCYPAAVTAFRQSQIALYNQWGETKSSEVGNFAPTLSQPTGQIVAEIQRAAAEIGVDLRQFPLCTLYASMTLQEKHLGQAAIGAQQREFVTRLLGAISEIPRLGDQKKVEALLQFWMRKTGLSLEEWTLLVQTRGFPAVFSMCDQWVLLWLNSKAQSSQMGQAQSAEIIEELMELALCLNVPFFDLRAFRHAVAHGRMASNFAALGATIQIAEAARAIVGMVPNPNAIRLFDIEERLHRLLLAVRIELTSVESELAEIAPGCLQPLAESVRAITGLPESAFRALRLERLDAALLDAATFYKLSRERGGGMAHRTLERMRAHKEDRAILVAGGFHERAITRTLEDHRQVSWSVLLPRPSL